MERKSLAGLLLMSGIWQILADPPKIQCGRQGTVLMANATNLYPLSAGEAYVWVNHDKMKSAFTPLKKAIEELVKHWAMGGHPLDESVEYPMEEVKLNLTQYEGELPKIYSTKQAAASLMEIRQACSKMGLVDLDLWTAEFSPNQRGDVMDAICKANQPLDKAYRDKCGKTVLLRDGGGYSGKNDCIAKKDTERATSIANGEACRIWINLQRQGLYLLGSLGSVVAEIPYQAALRPLGEDSLERLLRDIDQYPHTLRYKEYPVTQEVKVKCTGYQGLPAARPQDASAAKDDQCEQTKVTSKVYCREPMDYLGPDKQHRIQMREMVQKTQGDLDKLVKTFSEFGTAGLPEAQVELTEGEKLDLLDMGIPPEWAEFQKLTESLTWEQFTEVVPPTDRDLQRLQRYVQQSLKWLKKTARTMGGDEIERIKQGIPGDGGSRKKILYIGPEVLLTPVSRSAEGQIRMKADIKIARKMNSVMRWRLYPINRRGDEILDKFLTVDPRTAKGGTSIEDPTIAGHCTKIRNDGEAYYVCKDPTALTWKGNPVCARQILTDGTGASACNTQLSFKPTFFEHFCDNKVQVLVAPRDGVIMEKCYLSDDVSQEVPYDIVQGEQTLPTNCSLWFEGEILYKGKAIPQLRGLRNRKIDPEEPNDPEDPEDRNEGSDEMDYGDYIGYGAVILILVVGIGVLTTLETWKERGRRQLRRSSRQLPTREDMALDELIPEQTEGTTPRATDSSESTTRGEEQENPLLGPDGRSGARIMTEEPGISNARGGQQSRHPKENPPPYPERSIPTGEVGPGSPDASDAAWIACASQMVATILAKRYGPDSMTANATEIQGQGSATERGANLVGPNGPRPPLGSLPMALAQGSAPMGTGEPAHGTGTARPDDINGQAQNPPSRLGQESYGDWGSCRTGSRRSKSSRRASLRSRTQSLGSGVSMFGLILDHNGIPQGNKNDPASMYQDDLMDTQLLPM